MVEFATNPTAPRTTIPIAPPIAFPIFVEKEITVTIIPSERFPVRIQLSSISSPTSPTETRPTMLVAPYIKPTPATRRTEACASPIKKNAIQQPA